jgi:hypothetical protein
MRATARKPETAAARLAQPLGALSVAEIILRHPLDARNVSHNQVELRKGIHDQACVRSVVMTQVCRGYDFGV